ncbi:MAG TPA: FAD-dependent oxidoreductase, partial [Stellaceae bacterium]|nr:FAD-dependent oxidoreductase [Stellaceae bacterium]
RILSVTVSAAERFVDRPAAELGALFWRDVAVAYGLPATPVPPVRILKERRATFLASPEQLRRRPRTVTHWKNLLLAGDYVDTGLPGTIEGAIRSGLTAARLAQGRRSSGILASGILASGILGGISRAPPDGRSPAPVTAEEQRERCILP